MKIRNLASILLLVWLSGQCMASDGQSLPVTTDNAPTAKEIIRLLMINHNIPLSSHSSCEGVGTDFSDKTLGDYLSGFLAEFTDRNGKNWFELQTKQDKSGWMVRFMVRHTNGEDTWGWGVSFKTDMQKKTILKGSLMCLGGG